MYTSDFRRIYEENVDSFEKDAEKLVIQHMSATDAYIGTIAKNLDKPDIIEAINPQVFPVVVFCVGLRYHLLTCELVQQAQDKEMEVPESDEEFFSYMLIDYTEEPIDLGRP